MTNSLLAQNEQQEKMLSSLPFRIFVWIAHEDSYSDSKELDVFLKMLKRLSWCKSNYAKDLFPYALKHYSKHWKEYQNGQIQNELRRIQEAAQFLSNRLSPTETRILFEDLYTLAKAIARASGGFIGIGSISEGDHRVLHQLSIILDSQLMSSEVLGSLNDPVTPQPVDSLKVLPFPLQESEENLLISLPFRILIWIAGEDFIIGSEEIESFQKRLKELRWCKSSFAKDLFPQTLKSYPQFWKDFQKSQIKKELQSVQEAILIVKAHLSPSELEALVEDLNTLAKAVAKASGGFIGISSISKEQQQALKQLSVTLEYPLLLDPTSSKNHLTLDQQEKALATPPAKTAVSSQSPSTPISEPAAASYMPVALIPPEQMKRWTRGKITIRCIEILKITHNVKTFRFTTDPPSVFTYKPGQFLTLYLEIEGEKAIRSYTISSTPSRPHTLEITVKRVPGGLVSNWLIDHFKVGEQVSIRGPGGKFSCFDHPAPKMLMLSGGSGISPVMSMARWICDTGAECDVVFLHLASTRKDIIFWRELEMLQVQHQNFHLFLSITQPDPKDNWKKLTGRFSKKMLQRVAPDFQERTVYVCGPAGMMETAQKILKDSGFPMENYHYESFSDSPKPESKKRQTSPKLLPQVEVPTSATETPQQPVQEKAEINETLLVSPESSVVFFAKSNKEIESDEETTILELAEEYEIDIPSACRTGVCGTCKAFKIEGEVSMESVDGLEPGEQKEGYILTCMSCPKGRVVIDA